MTAFGTKAFTYSSENLLKTGPGSTTLSYDPLLRLSEVASASTTKLAYDGLDRIAEYNASNALQRRYVHGPGMDEPIVWYEGTGTTDRRFLSADERGSIVSVTDSAGTLLGVNRYDEYGQPQSTNLGVFGYTGQAWLPEIGEWYYKARIYDPELRFLQPDPIGYEDSPNLYAYVGNDPINFVDPLGLFQRGDTLYWRNATGWGGVTGHGGAASASWSGRLSACPADSICIDAVRPTFSVSDRFSVIGAGSDRFPAISIRPAAPLVPAAGNRYYGPTFCPRPTWDGRSFFYPEGRVTSGKEGDWNSALADADRLAQANGLSPLGSLPGFRTFSISNLPSLFSVPVGQGWWVYRNIFTGYVTFENSGVSFRYKTPDFSNPSVQINEGVKLPDGRISEATEVCHYH